MNSLQTYLVGGAVRDQLLGHQSADRDWVVVGASPLIMQELGYLPVGKDFPVYLHPDTKEEYALARTERKTAKGYHGFEFDTSSNVTLEQDLQRRDLTINAMALSDSGDIIDPWNGRRDLENRVLRHVSPAFAEDPLRVLRVARFCARLSPLGFTIAPETLALMQSLSDSGELTTLAQERIFAELAQSLSYPNPVPFFMTMRDCRALEKIFPELDQLFGVPQVAKYHPEIDSGIHTMMVLTQTCLLTDNSAARFASVCHDLGKGTTPGNLLPSHHGHEERGADLTITVANRLKVPNDHRNLAVLTARYHSHCHRALQLKTGSLLKLLSALDAFRRPDRFELFLLVCEGDARGRLGLEARPYPQANYLRGLFKQVNTIKAGEIAKQATEAGKPIADLIRETRLQVISSYRKEHRAALSESDDWQH